MADELSIAKDKLSKVLGKVFTNYCNLLKKWFSGKMSKEDFDMEARLLFTIQTIHYHNDFLAALLNKCNIQLESDQKSTSSLTGLKALKRLRRSASAAANINPERTLSTSTVHKSLTDALPALASAHINNIQPSLSCSKDGVLPDSSMIHGRLLIVCWENDLDCLDSEVLPLIFYALRDALKDLIHACVEKKRSYLTYDGKFQHLFGVDDAETVENIAMPGVSKRIAGETLELKEMAIASTFVSKTSSKISILDLIECLKEKQEDLERNKQLTKEFFYDDENSKPKIIVLDESSDEKSKGSDDFKKKRDKHYDNEYAAALRKAKEREDKSLGSQRDKGFKNKRDEHYANEFALANEKFRQMQQEREGKVRTLNSKSKKTTLPDEPQNAQEPSKAHDNAEERANTDQERNEDGDRH